MRIPYMSNNSHMLTGHIDKKHLYSGEGWIQAVIIFAKSVIICTYLLDTFRLIIALERMNFWCNFQYQLHGSIFFTNIEPISWQFFNLFIELPLTILAQVQKMYDQVLWVSTKKDVRAFSTERKSYIQRNVKACTS